MDDEPEIDEAGRFYLDSFFELSTDRPNDGSLIPRMAIMDFADRAGLDLDVAQLFASVIRMLDFEYLEWIRENRASDGGL